MITIIHGSDTATSRKFYIEQREASVSYVLIENKKITYDEVYQSIEGDSLFGGEKQVFIENFFSSVKSNSIEYKKIVEYLNSNKLSKIIFWEEKELSKPQQFVFKTATLKAFNYPSNLFAFLDSLKPGNSSAISIFKDLENAMETELIFYMMVRQFRLLLSTLGTPLIDEAKRMQSWQKSKILKQANYFGKDKLIQNYKDLYIIDHQTKFGLTPFNLSSSIDIFLSDL